MRFASRTLLIACLSSLWASAAMAQNDKPSNTMGDIQNNQGIITQGQTGNNTIINPIRRDPNGIYQG